ncbi:MAG: PASTA domain-containing protein [Gemmatimonadales bacterium]|nr:MAG: PASTA domain-containing protein [Gemmatimonadales bacterium]
MMTRSFQLQVVQGDQWHTRALIQTTERTEIRASRGGLYDRNMQPLTVSQDKYRVFYAAAEVEDRDRTLEMLRRILNLGTRDVARLRGATGGWEPLGQVRGREKNQIENAVPSGVHFEAVTARIHPAGPLAIPMLGAVDSDGRGLSGFELVFDELLAGTPGEQLNRRDAHGVLYPIPQTGIVPAQPGRDIVLTIDAELQEIAEAALARALSETGASGGDVILADPTTGEILALASRSSDSDFGIPALTNPYEPGSTAKMVLLATLLQEDLAELDESIDVEGGSYRTPYRTITDVHGYDSLSVAGVILHSSNIGAAKLAERIEPGMQYSYLRDFGFGTPTGIETPSESAGLLRRPADWSLLSQQSLAYGYEMTVTSIQLVAAYGALANGGVLMRPTLIREIRTADGRVEFRGEPRPVRRVIDQSVADQITDVLTEVVREGGTGDEASLGTIDIAGKTGTSRIAAGGSYGASRYIASFVGYIPADDPQLVVLAKLDDPRSTIYGGAAAAPVSRTVMQAIVAAEESGFLTGQLSRRSAARYDWSSSTVVPPVDQTPFRFATTNATEVITSPRHESDDVVVPDVRGRALREAVKLLHEAGLEVEVDDDVPERVRSTQPAAGSFVVPGATVLLH